MMADYMDVDRTYHASQSAVDHGDVAPVATPVGQEAVDHQSTQSATAAAQ